MNIEKTNSIAIIFSGLYVGGAEKFGISLANRFVASGVRTHLILFETFRSVMFDQVDERIEIVYIDRKSKVDFVLHKEFDAEVARRNINKIIFFCLSPLFYTRVFSFQKNKDVSYFISLHSTIPASFKVYLKHLLFLFFARKTDKVLFICQNQRTFHYDKYFFRPSLYDVIYNGVDVEYFKPGNGLVLNKKDEMAIGPNDKVILLVATLRPEKGHSYAIESLNILHNDYADKKHTHLVFTGDGDKKYVEELKQLVSKYSLESFVHFEGNQKDVRKYYEIADVFTLTSFSVETFSIAGLEAMCYGLPLSLTNIGGASEMVIEGKNGLLSKPKDSKSIAATWANLLDAKLDKNEIREIAVNNYSLDLIFKKYYKAILE